jgi:hypothetical protein
LTLQVFRPSTIGCSISANSGAFGWTRWKAAFATRPATPAHYPESYLTIELEPRGKDVLLTLTHMPILDGFEKQNAMGWHTFLDMLAAAVRGAAPEPLNVYMKRNAERYGGNLANLAR